MVATLKVFCAGAVKSALVDLAKGYEQETGNRLQFAFGTVGNLQAKAAAGESADIVILTRPVLEQMAQQGKVLRDTIADLGRVGVGIAVRRDAALPDVSTPDALRESLIAARSLAYGDPAKGDSSGIHFAKVLERLGVAREINAKSVLAPVGLAVAELVQQGEVEIGATQASVILACKGVTLAGLLPSSLQHLTTYSLGVMAGAASCQVANLFVGYLTTPLAKSTFSAAGFEQDS